MDRNQAQQIAKLLIQNELTVIATETSVIANQFNYVFIEVDNIVMACAEVKSVQWYQYEICHVSVKELQRGYGKRIIIMAEEQARKKNARVMQCTIRTNNIASIALFKSLGYSKGITFYNSKSQNELFTFQKALSVRPT